MRVKLKDAFNLQMGKTPSRADLSLWGGNNKWISIADIGSAKKHISSTKECITDEGVSRSGIKVVPEGTVIMSFKLSIGKTAIVSEDMYTNEAIMAFIDNGTYCIDPNYLYHLCCGTDWTQGGNKAVMGLTLNKATLSEMEIELPTIEEQREIASILDQLDAIIEKRHDELNMIEQLVKSRFIELFGEPLTNTKGWQTMPLVEAAPIKSRRGNLVDEIWLLNLDAVEAQTGTILFKHRVLNEEINASTVYFTTENVLYSKLRPYLNKVVMPDEDGVATSEMIPMYPRADRLNRAYLCYWLRSDAFVKHISEKVAGAKMPRVSMDYFRSLSIELPPLELQEQFAAFIEQTDKSKLAVQKGLQELELLKKSLMQQYFG